MSEPKESSPVLEASMVMSIFFATLKVAGVISWGWFVVWTPVIVCLLASLAVLLLSAVVKAIS